MLSSPERREIDHHTIKLLVGVIALSLAALTNYLADSPLQSISASYHEDGWSRDIFVGFLFAVSAFLLAYNGRSAVELVLSKIAAIAAVGIALFPCECDGHHEIVPHLHGLSAAVMFVILAIFCYSFFRRAKGKGHASSLGASDHLRRLWYLDIGGHSRYRDGSRFWTGRLARRSIGSCSYGEAVALVAFGVAWLTASRILPIITSSKERLSLSPF